MSQFRQNIVTGDWVIMAPERAKRPDEFLGKSRRREAGSESQCPFEDLEATGNWPPLIADPDMENWKVVVIKNKYPALAHIPNKPVPSRKGPYVAMDGVGHHEVVITRDHTKDFQHLTKDEAARVLRIMQLRYRVLSQDLGIEYSSAIFNWGESAGASLHHPHYQIISVPVIPSDISHSLAGSKRFFLEHGVCVHCTVLKYERRVKERVIDENEGAIVIAPYASARPFEVRIFPKKHVSHFEDAPEKGIEAVAEMLQSALARIQKHLHDPDLNFYLHSAPLKNKPKYPYYHWHIEVIPKVSTPPAGFELGTRTHINVIPPETATAVLKGVQPFA